MPKQSPPKADIVMAKTKAIATKDSVTVRMTRKQLAKFKRWLDITNHGVGVETEYHPKYCKEVVEFFTIEPFRTGKIAIYDKKGRAIGVEEVDLPNPPPFLVDFANKIGVYVQTVMKWSEVHQPFNDALMHAKEIRTKMLVTNGLLGHYNANSWIFAAKNLSGMTDKTDINATHDVKFNVNLQRFGNPEETDEVVVKTDSDALPPMLR